MLHLLTTDLAAIWPGPPRPETGTRWKRFFKGGCLPARRPGAGKGWNQRLVEDYRVGQLTPRGNFVMLQVPPPLRLGTQKRLPRP